MGRWSLSLAEGGTYSATTRGCTGQQPGESGTWTVDAGRLKLAGKGTLASFAGDDGFIIGTLEGHATLTSELNVLTFYPLHLSAYYLPDMIPPGHPDKRHLPEDHPESILRAEKLEKATSGVMSNSPMQTDGGFAATADRPNR